ncbi:nicotinate-nucleotide--dimethylbenzimidazole phosphoribosyltransferase [Streptomyces sp. NPDC058914]|uniref:nicotinate-nucleotide--dimethylbenzimidazole phosphoribosyltransferase n=1 Tax=Streptomyces sp. NPDC058914 TaxID=3346671 RepID=UPI0036758FCB
MTDTGQVPGEGLPENAGMVEQPGASAPGAYTYLSETTAEDEDLLLLPGAQSAWGNEVAPPAPEPVVEAVHEPGPHETAGRDSGSVDLSGVRLPGPTAPSTPIPPITPRRPLHLGPPLPDTSASPVRSLADRGPAGAPVRHPGPPTSGPEYLDIPQTPPQGAAPWGAQAAPQAPVASGADTAETVVPQAQPQPEPVGAAQAVVARVATQAVAATGAPEAEEEHGHAAGTPQPAEAAYAGAGAQAGPAGVIPAEGAAGGAAFAAATPNAPAAEPVSAAVPGPDQVTEPAVAPAVDQPGDAAQAPEAVPVPESGHVEEAAAPVAPEPAQAPAPVAAEPVPAPDADSPGAAQPSEAADAPAAPAADGATDATGIPAAPAPAAVAEAPVAEAAQPPETPATVAVPAPAPEASVPGTAPEAPASEAAAHMAEEAPAADAAAGTPAPDAAQAPEAAPEPAPAPAPETAAPATPEAQEQVTAPAEVQEPAAAPAEETGSAAVAQSSAASADQVVPGAPAEQAALTVPAEQAAPAAEADASVAEAAAAVPATETSAPAPEPVAEAPAEPAVSAEAAVSTEPAVPDAHGLADAPMAAPAGTSAEPFVRQAGTEDEQVLQEQPTAEPPVSAAPASDPTTAPQPEQQAEPAHAAPAAAHIADPASHAPGVVAPVTAEAEAAPEPAPHNAPHADAAPPAESQPNAPLGQFVPVDGTVPTTPHLAPTPPHPLTLPEEPRTAEQQAAEPRATELQAADFQAAEVQAAEPHAMTPGAPAAETPVATVPAPREGGAPVAAAPQAEPERTPEHDPNVAQNPEDLDTRAADQEEGQEEGTAQVEEVRQPTGPAAPGYDEAEREAVLKVMRERRDIRNGFRSDPIPHEVLLRVLEAAHTAPSVGHSQPWDFVVIRSADTRRAMHELAMRQRDEYAKSLPKGRAKQFKELKVEAILDTPVNIVVTADPTRGGRHTLGRHTQPQMAPYSAALAVENLWLAARAEGLGVGWVSFFDEREMVRALGLPEHLEVIAYLCVGYVDEFPDEPELMQAGWAKRRPLSWVVHEETYGRRALPGEDPHDLLAETVAGIRPLDAKALGEAWERQKRMTKPAGALGMLEIISAQLSGLSRQCPPPIPEPAAVAIFAGDHGVHAQGVTPWPQEVTAQMVANFLGGGAVCNAFATQVGAEVCVVDVGVAADLPATPGLLPRKVRAGTSDMTTGPAMTREEAKQAIEVGIETARDLVAAGNKALLTGEMGIANTTASAALISVFTGADPAEVTGRGTGINDETLARKTDVVRRALELHQPDPADPIGVLAAIGGFEHAAMVGLLLGGASLRTPVILDGVSAGAAALVARAIAPEVLAACIAGHRSAEPGHVAALNKLGLRPLVDLDLRLGEGTGALLALPMVQSTARAMHEVATFDSAGVTEK